MGHFDRNPRARRSNLRRRALVKPQHPDRRADAAREAAPSACEHPSHQCLRDDYSALLAALAEDASAIWSIDNVHLGSLSG
jgi:hypothetical protein